jgi:hypothetical protein
MCQIDPLQPLDVSESCRSRTFKLNHGSTALRYSTKLLGLLLYHAGTRSDICSKQRIVEAVVPIT